MQGISIQPYTKEDLAQFTAYIHKNFHHKYIMGDECYLKWQFDTLLLARANGVIVGHLGYKDMPYACGNETVMVRELMNLYIEESYRTFGIGVLLLQQAVAESAYSIILGFKNKVLDALSRIQNGWSAQNNLRRCVAVLDADAPLYEELSIPTLPNIPTSVPANVIEVNTCTDDFNTFWEGVRSHYPFTTERSVDYLNWRFAHHPFFSYTMFCARNGKNIEGYVVLRTEEDQGFVMSRIVDLVAREHAAASLLSAAIAKAYDFGSHGIDFMFSGAEQYIAPLQSVGFFDVEGTDFEKFPIRFSPISYDKLTINAAYRAHVAFADTFFTKAGLDMDRPNPR